MLLAVVVLAGLFIVRRIVRLAHFGGIPHSTQTAAGAAPANETTENISPQERKTLDQIIHDKARP
ncbi:MAG: hypothetical protein ACREQC_16470 [Candidatus Binataceae bacterium]